jgi:rubrerythrin
MKTDQAVAPGKPDSATHLELTEMLRSHGQREGSALASYQSLAEQSDDDGLRYLVRLIMDDETRHHQQIADMLNDEMHPFRWYDDKPPTVPVIKVRDDPALREETDRLLAFEKEDMKDLRRLRKELQWSHGNPHGDPLLPLLVDLMLHDTAKHIEILQFIRARTRRG